MCQCFEKHLCVAFGLLAQRKESPCLLSDGGLGHNRFCRSPERRMSWTQCNYGECRGGLWCARRPAQERGVWLQPLRHCGRGFHAWWGPSRLPPSSWLETRDESVGRCPDQHRETQKDVPGGPHQRAACGAEGTCLGHRVPFSWLHPEGARIACVHVCGPDQPLHWLCVVAMEDTALGCCVRRGTKQGSGPQECLGRRSEQKQEREGHHRAVTQPSQPVVSVAGSRAGGPTEVSSQNTRHGAQGGRHSRPRAAAAKDADWRIRWYCMWLARTSKKQEGDTPPVVVPLSGGHRRIILGQKWT